MSKVLAGLLGKTEAEISKTVGRLEALAGFPSEDTRLLAENEHDLRTKLGQLGLDPDDTTGQELFHVLRSKFAGDSELLDRALGVNTLSTLDDKILKATHLAREYGATSEVWAVKLSAIKRLLKASPPKKTMKLLGYRSAESLIKREDPLAVVLAAGSSESTGWQKSFAVKLKKLDSTDYELRPLKIVQITSNKWQPDNHVDSNDFVGAIALWRSPNLSNASVLALTLLLCNEAQKFTDSKANRLTNVHPALRFWQNSEHLLAWNDGEPVSLNFKDACLADLRDLSYASRSTEHGAEALYRELLEKYKQHMEILPEELNHIGHQLENGAAKLRSPARELALEYAEG